MITSIQFGETDIYTPLIQVKPAPTDPSTQSKDSSTDTTQIKVQLQQAIEGMDIEYQNPEVHEAGYMSDGGLATPGSSSRNVDRVYIQSH